MCHTVRAIINIFGQAIINIFGQFDKMSVFFAVVWVHLVRQKPDIATHEDQGEPMEQVANWSE